MLDAVKSAGMTDDQASAKGYLGESTAALARPSAGIPEPIALGRIRAFGQPTAVMGIVKGIDDPAPSANLTLQKTPPALPLNPPADGSAIIVLLVLGAAIAATFGAGYRLAATGAMAMVLGAAAYAGGPTLLAAGLSGAAMGWLKNRANGCRETRLDNRQANPGYLRVASCRDSGSKNQILGYSPVIAISTTLFLAV